MAKNGLYPYILLEHFHKHLLKKAMRDGVQYLMFPGTLHSKAASSASAEASRSKRAEIF